MPIWVYVCIGLLIVAGIMAAVIFGSNLDWNLAGIEKPITPTPAPLDIVPIAEPEPEPEPEPLTLDDIRISVIRVGELDITVLLDWAKTPSDTPFHLWVSVDGGNLILNAPDNEPRKVEILHNEALTLFSTTLHHIASDNRLVIDLQVETNKETQQ